MNLPRAHTKATNRSGLIPVLGIPMPLVSYGGTAMLTVMFGFGLFMSVHVDRQVEIPRHAAGLIG